jgi:tRNA(Ile)-lysidine synthase
VLFRLLRGSARRGLAGIPPARDGWIVRPLLGCSRQEVLEYLTSQYLPYATDASNADLRYTRNKIRHVLLPLLEREFAPQVRVHLARLAETLRLEEEWLESLATAARTGLRESSLTLSLKQLSVQPAALQVRILRQWLEQTGQTRDIGFRHLESLSALSAGRIRGKVELPGKVYVKREGGRLLLKSRQTENTASPYCYTLVPGQAVLIPETGWQVIMTSPCFWHGAPLDARSTDPWQAIFDVDALPPSLVIRTLQPGDWIQPLGMQGSKKVHDIFVDAKVPQLCRRLLPLIVIGTEVAWVPGCVRGEAAKVTAGTRAVCWVVVNPLPEK